MLMDKQINKTLPTQTSNTKTPLWLLLLFLVLRLLKFSGHELFSSQESKLPRVCLGFKQPRSCHDVERREEITEIR